jgi:hypothetical protein
MTSEPSPSESGRLSDLKKLDFQVVFVLLSSIVLFTIFWYFGRRNHYFVAWHETFKDGSDLQPLYPFFYFVFCSVLLRTVLPMLCVKFIFKKRLADFGFSLRGAGTGGWIYLGLFLAMIPLVIYASTTPAFQNYYPQFKGVIHDGEVRWQHVLAFELVYGMLFVSGESFWRGYMIFGLEKKFGYYGILIMVIPYVMSHYEKPFMETMGAIVAGSVLGFLALKHRNFWLGVLVHWGVAMTMDFMALYQLGIKIV